MARARGTYAVIDNWARKLAPTLPGAAGWVLLELSYQSNYHDVFMQVGDLTRALPYKERAIEIALSYLVQAEYAEKHRASYCLKGAHVCAEKAQERAEKAQVEARATRTDVRFQEAEKPRQEQEGPVPNPAIEMHNKKEEGIEGKEIKTNAQESTAPVQTPLSQKSVAQKNTPAVASKINAPELDKVPSGAAHQQMFGALALACYGGHDSLTDAARGRVSRVAKSLTKANFTAEDVPLIVLWMQTTEGESWRSVSVSNIEDRAPVWRSALRGSLPLSAASPNVIKFQPRPQTTDEANNRAAQRASDIYQMLQEETHAVF